ncbi:hypothetical protein [Actinomycetospora termitidis]|uniref:Uncharacterized protein n=1 Tax=Actinomycetospora termitidis TaxID=3053470 RepID=A0ABT7M700_9PSEU|nr:hypothetical protein [Actinomycetospora sp. Odt1-22]MDL5155233.1 hypothetical protein [Actinomycetospora sp. Odt1-22]
MTTHDAAPEQIIGHRDEAERARLEEARSLHRRLSGEVTILENFDRRLTRQIHEKEQEPARGDYVRELVQRRISVRSRLEEMRLRRNRAAEAAGL